ncbi:GMC oxidoreductase [Peniophora sp. CONT]|nr:GMC oxidoreductase [Peniophora sp. CONT]
MSLGRFPGQHILRLAMILLLPLLLCAELGHAVLFLHLNQLDRTEFDFVVIGGGPGGSVVASRLSEDPRISVLLVEAGPPQKQFEPNVEIPGIAATLTPGTPLDWNYTINPQEHLANRSIPYPRGKLLGGSSATNYLVWTRGSADDYDRWANITGDPRWAWSAIEPLAKGIETLSPPADGHDTAGEIVPRIHGHSGPLGISVQGWPDQLIPRILATTQELSDEFPFNEDMNSGNPLGVGWTQWSIRNGTRSTAATAYLHPNLRRPNLVILTNTLATRLVKSGSNGILPEFKQVDLSTGPNGSLSRSVKALREVIVSGGAINSPQLLMLSGIGDRQHLDAVGIETLVDLPGVGRNLHDHTLVSLNWAVNASFTLDTISQNATVFNEVLDRWLVTRKGVFSAGSSLHIGWLRLPENSTTLQTLPDPSAGPLSPHFEILFMDKFSNHALPNPAEGHFMTIAVVLVSPTARGAVTLNSTDPFDHPVIDPALLGTEFDRLALRDAVKQSLRIVTAPTWSDYITGPAVFTANLTSDEAIDDFNANTGYTIYHPVGTTAMGAWNDTSGLAVVNPDLTVKGTSGLRVVDASIFPFIPGAHTQVPTYIVAENVALFIKGSLKFD